MVSIYKLPDKTEEKIFDFRLTRTFKLIEALPSHQALSHTENVVVRNPKVNVKLKLRIKLRLKLFPSTLRRHVGGGEEAELFRGQKPPLVRPHGPLKLMKSLNPRTARGMVAFQRGVSIILQEEVLRLTQVF